MNDSARNSMASRMTRSGRSRMPRGQEVTSCGRVRAMHTRRGPRTHANLDDRQCHSSWRQAGPVLVGSRTGQSLAGRLPVRTHPGPEKPFLWQSSSSSPCQVPSQPSSWLPLALHKLKDRSRGCGRVLLPVDCFSTSLQHLAPQSCDCDRNYALMVMTEYN